LKCVPTAAKMEMVEQQYNKNGNKYVSSRNTQTEFMLAAPHVAPEYAPHSIKVIKEDRIHRRIDRQADIRPLL